MRSWVLRVNPLVLLTVGFCSLLGSLAIRELSVALIAAGVYAGVALLLLPSWKYPLLCVLLAGVAALSIAYSTWRGGGHDEREALTAGVRIMVLAWPGSVALGFVDPARLADYLAQSLHVPARFVAALSAALQRLATLGATWQQLDRTRRVRGFGPSANPVASTRYAADMSFALLVDALRAASRSAVAMDARGFATAHHRSWAEPATWSRLDAAGMLFAIALGAVAPVLALL